MLRHAISELRLHPGRYVATLIAIAISVGFIAAISVFISTEQSGTAKANSMGLSTSDLAVHLPDGGVPADAAESVAAVDGVAAVQPVASLLTNVESGDRTAFATLWVDVSPEFRWAAVEDGSYPSGADEITVSRSMADDLGIGIGDRVDLGVGDASVVGITRDAKSLFAHTGYVSDADAWGAVPSALGVSLANDADAASTAAAIEAAVPGIVAEPADDYRKAQFIGTMGEFDVFRNLLFAFAGVALLVGVITISNTFTILVTQRRRQLGLLRAVGATGGQVMGRLLVESVLLGLAGSLAGIALGVGVAAVGATVTGSIFWGLAIEWAQLGIAVLIGIAATVVAAVLPAITASRVAPMAALQAVPSGAEARRAGIVRVIVCVLFLAGGGLLAVTALGGSDEMSVVYAIGAGGLLTIGVLGAAPLFVPTLLRAIGGLTGWAGPTSRLALKNSARNPKRASATATALMLAIGLVVTLQVGLASVRASAMDAIDQEFPLDLAATYPDGVPAGTAQRVAEVDGVEAVAVLEGKQVAVDDMPMTAVDDHSARLAMGVESEPIPDGVARVDDPDSLGETLTIGSLTLDVEQGRLYGWSTFGVSAATLTELPGDATQVAVWVKLVDRTDASAINQVVKALSVGGEPDLSNSGAQMAGIFESVINVLMLVMTALLGVAVAIAIVGVSNTLGLSVIERQRESALLRALGMQRRQLRGMLLIEALALAVVGIVVGVGAGIFFAWLGLSSVLAAAPGSIALRLTIEPAWTATLIGVCLAAAGLASVLPGRRAANATPTEALAVE